MKRKHKKYSKPKRPFDKARIEEEAKIRKEFGLKNKKEIWKAEAQIKSIREKAKKLIGKKEEEQKKLLDKLNAMGIKVSSIADILALDKRDYLKRRIQTIVVEKKLATTPKLARQLIVHKKVLVDGQVVNIPSYIVPVKLESKIKLKEKTKKEKVKEIKSVSGTESQDSSVKNAEREENE